MKKNQAKVPIIFSSDDSEGTDLSFNSSFEEKPVRDQNGKSLNFRMSKIKITNYVNVFFFFFYTHTRHRQKNTAT